MHKFLSWLGCTGSDHRIRRWARPFAFCLLSEANLSIDLLKVTSTNTPKGPPATFTFFFHENQNFCLAGHPRIAAPADKCASFRDSAVHRSCVWLTYRSLISLQLRFSRVKQNSSRIENDLLLSVSPMTSRAESVWRESRMYCDASWLSLRNGACKSNMESERRCSSERARCRSLHNCR